MSEMKVAVIGVGHLGKFHARKFADMPDVELIAVVDPDLKAAEDVAKQCNTKPLTSYEEILGEVEAVSIVVPTRAHYKVARDFLEARVPVMIEKPITEKVATAKELVELGRSNDTLIQVGHIERFNPAHVAVRNEINAPRFIESHRLAPYSFRSRDVDVVMDLMIHDIDIVLDLVKSPLVEAQATGFSVLSKSEDIANARLVFKNGCVANVTASRISTNAMRKIRIFSRNSYVSLDYGQRKAWIYRPTEAIVSGEFDIEEYIKAADSKSANLKDAIFKDLVSIEEVAMDDADQLESELSSFIGCVRDGSEPVVSGADGLRALEAATLIVEKIKSHSWLD